MRPAAIWDWPTHPWYLTKFMLAAMIWLKVCLKCALIALATGWKCLALKRYRMWQPPSNKSPSVFYSQSYWKHPFLGLGSPRMRPGPPSPSEELLQPSLPPGEAEFVNLPLLPASMWILYIFRHKYCGQLDFRWFSTSIILFFSCNFNASLGRGKSCFYLVRHIP